MHPGKDYYRISVKREEQGVVSNFLHDEVSEGSILPVSAPAGLFVLEERETPVVLISGGVGLTPMVSMLNTIIDQKSEREVTFIHGALNSNVHALKDEVAQIAKEHDNVKNYVAYSAPTESDRIAEIMIKKALLIYNGYNPSSKIHQPISILWPSSIYESDLPYP